LSEQEIQPDLSLKQCEKAVARYQKAWQLLTPTHEPALTQKVERSIEQLLAIKHKKQELALANQKNELRHSVSSYEASADSNNTVNRFKAFLAR
jgi:hypothetical protein